MYEHACCEEIEMEEKKIIVNLSLVGHTWHGKSTILGRFLWEIGRVSDREMEKYKKMARDIIGDTTHVYSLILHRGREEIEKTSERGIIGSTVMTSHARVEISNKLITFIDTPGHPMFKKNKIYGIFQSDCAILVVEADEINIKEKALEPEKRVKPGTIEALHILRSFEVPLVAVTISKMDEVDYSMEKYERCVDVIQSLLGSLHYDTDSIFFFPTAALHGEGIREYSQIKWFDGPTFEDVLGSINIYVEREEQPLRLTVYSSEVYTIPGRGLAIRGTVESGALERDNEIIFQPISEILKQDIRTRVRSLQLTKAQATPGIPIERAVPRNIVGALITEHPKFDLHSLLEHYGNVAGTLKNPPQTATKFEAEIFLIEHPTPILRGHSPSLNVHVDQAPATLSDIFEKRKGDGDWDPADVKSIRSGEQARVEFSLLRPVAVEESENLPWLSRFVIRSGIGIEGFGKCTKIIE